MRFFVDTADVAELEKLVVTGMVDGVTTNPSLIAKSGRDILEVTKEIAALVPGPVSAEVTATDFDTMMEEGQKLAKIADNIAVKVPLTVDGQRTCKALSDQGTMVNVTLCFSSAQALLAAKAGATFISPFVGRLDDMGMDDMEGMEAGMDGSDAGGGIDSSSGGQTSGTTGSTAAAASPHPANLRYVDNTLKRLDAQRLQAAVAPGPNPPLETIYLAVAKRYPIRLRIKMDLTKLPDLLTACGNAKLPIEVLQVSINGSAGRSGAGSGGGAMGDELSKPIHCPA